MLKVLMICVVVCLLSSPTIAGIQYIDSSANTVYLTNTMTIPYPAAQVSGNGQTSPTAHYCLLSVAYTTNDGNMDAAMTVDGWSLIALTAFSSGYTAVFGRQWDALPGDVTINWSGIIPDDIRAVGTISSWAGVHALNPIDTTGTASTGVGPFQTIGGLWTSYANDVLVGVWGGPNTGVFYSPAGGFTEIFQGGNFGGMAGRSLTVSYGLQTLAGATGAKLAQSFDLFSGDPTDSNAGIALIALRPAP